MHGDGEICDWRHSFDANLPEIGAPYDLPVCRSNRCRGQDGIHTAGAITLRIERNVNKAEWTKGRGDPIEYINRECAREFVARDLNAGKLSVMANAYLLEPESVERLLGLFDLGEIFAGYRTAIFDTRGETSRSGFVPEIKPGLLCQLADFGFAELGSYSGAIA